ncbi:unannotated protein [freshwater metagenome]|uniref:Unannotated protein n=1 Tax=freshwater metagenome TaxID=449393 RepID=A0A6J6E6S5_9ZZZZ
MPVLSKTAVSISRDISNTRGLRRTMPRSAPRPDATSRATGVANPSAQGQAITSTVIAVEIEKVSDSS